MLHRIALDDVDDGDEKQGVERSQERKQMLLSMMKWRVERGEQKMMMMT